MKHTENLIFLILIGCLFICGFFWHQMSEIQVSQDTPPSLTAKSQEDLDALPEILSLTKMPAPVIPKGRDAFRLPWKKEDRSRSLLPAPVEETPTLSTIVWSQTNPMAVIDGEILGIGEIDSKRQFKVETVTRESVRVRYIDTSKTVLLTLNENH